jgi:hypothetical protein
VKEFETLLPVFAEAFAATQSSVYTQSGKVRQRQAGGGRTARLRTDADKLLFILVYQKTYPLQTSQGLQFEMSQAQTNEWIHRLLPVLKQALDRLGYKPEADPAAFRQSGATADAPPALVIDGTERRRQRPKTPEKQRENYSGKKKAHTDKNLIIANDRTRQVAYLSQTYPGKTHDKKMAETEAIQYPAGAQLTKDLGFQGYEPAQVFTIQPKKQWRGKFLSAVDVLSNHLIAGSRIVVEHVIAGIKRCRIVKDVFRNRATGFSDLVMQVACALHNLRTDFRYLRSFSYQLKDYFR